MNEAHPGFAPPIIDEMELWQIAVLFEKHKLTRPMMPTEPEDWADRVAAYQGFNIPELRKEQKQRSAERRAEKRRKALGR